MVKEIVAQQFTTLDLNAGESDILGPLPEFLSGKRLFIYRASLSAEEYPCCTPEMEQKAVSVRDPYDRKTARFQHFSVAVKYTLAVISPKMFRSAKGH